MWMNIFHLYLFSKTTNNQVKRSDITNGLFTHLTISVVYFKEVCLCINRMAHHGCQRDAVCVVGLLAVRFVYVERGARKRGCSSIAAPSPPSNCCCV